MGLDRERVKRLLTMLVWVVIIYAILFLLLAVMVAKP